MAKSKARNRPDWELVENEYRIGQLTIRQMAGKHEIAPSTIVRRAEKSGWTRDLMDAVKRATQAKLIDGRATERAQNAHAAIDTAATLNAWIIESHRQDIADQRALMGELRAELRRLQQVDSLSVDALQTLVNHGAISALQIPKLTKALKDSCSLTARVQMIKALAETAVKTITVERQAYGLDDEAEGKKPPLDPAKLQAMEPMEVIKLLVQADEKAGSFL